MKNILCFLTIVCVVGFSTGCASILSGTSQKLNFTTDSGKQEVLLIDGIRYTVPAIIELKRENKDKIITMENCPQQQVLLSKTINMMFWVNIFSGGVFGSTTDYASGAMWAYGPENINIRTCPVKEK